MTQPTISRQALRHLIRLCRSTESSPSYFYAPVRRSICSLSQTSGTRTTSHNHSTQRRAHNRVFSTSLASHVQPSPSEETDPQNTVTATLPDITNYYTLFPSTLPSGPPGPPPKEQSPTTSPSSSNSSPSPATFTVHLPTLRKEFLRLQSQHHPDKYPTGTQSHTKALALSALINNAYKTLSDPLLRAQYLLNLQYDIDVTSEDNAAHPTDQETLMEVMEAQERVEDAETQEEVDEIREENERRMIDTEKVMGEAFESGNATAAKEECVRLKYWRSLQGALHEWEPGKEVRLIH